MEKPLHRKDVNHRDLIDLSAYTCLDNGKGVSGNGDDNEHSVIISRKPEFDGTSATTESTSELLQEAMDGIREIEQMVASNDGVVRTYDQKGTSFSDQSPTRETPDASTAAPENCFHKKLMARAEEMKKRRNTNKNSGLDSDPAMMEVKKTTAIGESADEERDDNDIYVSKFGIGCSTSSSFSLPQRISSTDYLLPSSRADGFGTAAISEILAAVKQSSNSGKFRWKNHRSRPKISSRHDAYAHRGANSPIESGSLDCEEEVSSGGPEDKFFHTMEEREDGCILKTIVSSCDDGQEEGISAKGTEVMFVEQHYPPDTRDQINIYSETSKQDRGRDRVASEGRSNPSSFNDGVGVIDCDNAFLALGLQQQLQLGFQEKIRHKSSNDLSNKNNTTINQAGSCNSLNSETMSADYFTIQRQDGGSLDFMRASPVINLIDSFIEAEVAMRLDSSANDQRSKLFHTIEKEGCLLRTVVSSCDEDNGQDDVTQGTEVLLVEHVSEADDDSVTEFNGTVRNPIRVVDSFLESEVAMRRFEEELRVGGPGEKVMKAIDDFVQSEVAMRKFEEEMQAGGDGKRSRLSSSGTESTANDNNKGGAIDTTGPTKIAAAGSSPSEEVVRITKKVGDEPQSGISRTMANTGVVKVNNNCPSTTASASSTVDAAHAISSPRSTADSIDLPASLSPVIDLTTLESVKNHFVLSNLGKHQEGTNALQGEILPGKKFLEPSNENRRVRLSDQEYPDGSKKFDAKACIADSGTASGLKNRLSVENDSNETNSFVLKPFPSEPDTDSKSSESNGEETCALPHIIKMLSRGCTFLEDINDKMYEACETDQPSLLKSSSNTLKKGNGSGAKCDNTDPPESSDIELDGSQGESPSPFRKGFVEYMARSGFAEDNSPGESSTDTSEIYWSRDSVSRKTPSEPPAQKAVSDSSTDGSTVEAWDRERLLALKLAEKMQRRVTAMKRRRKVQEWKHKHLKTITTNEEALNKIESTE